MDGTGKSKEVCYSQSSLLSLLHHPSISTYCHRVCMDMDSQLDIVLTYQIHLCLLNSTMDLTWTLVHFLVKMLF
jgi:hypothetical protein